MVKRILLCWYHLTKKSQSSNSPEEDLFSSQKLVSELNDRKNKAFLVESYPAVVDLIKDQCRLGDVIVLMSNGGFGGIYPDIVDVVKHKG